MNVIREKIREHRILISDVLMLSAVCAVLTFFQPFHFIHPDYLVRHAFETLRQHGHPPIFHYPGFIMYLYAVVYGGVLCLMYLAGTAGSPMEMIRAGFPVGPDYNQNIWLEVLPSVNMSLYFPGYLINLGFSVIAIGCVYIILLRVTEKRYIALTGGIFLTTSYLWAKAVNHLAGDLPVAAMTLLAVVVTLRYTDQEKPLKLWWVVLLGALVGLATSTKPSGVMVAAAVGVAMFFCYRERRGLMLVHLVLTGFSAVCVYALTNPFIFTSIDQLISNFVFVAEWQRSGAPGYQRVNHTYFVHITDTLIPMYGYIGLILAGVGIIGLILTRSCDLRTRLTILAFPAVYYVVTGKSSYGPSRYMYTFAPYLAIFSGVGILLLYSFLRKVFLRSGRSVFRYAAHGSIAIVLAVSVVSQAALTVKDAILEYNGNTMEHLSRAVRHSGIGEPLDIMVQYYMARGLTANGIHLRRSGFVRLLKYQRFPSVISCDSFDMILLDEFSAQKVLRMGLDRRFSYPGNGCDFMQVIQLTQYYKLWRRESMTLDTVENTEKLVCNGETIEICSPDTSIIGRIRRSCDRNSIPYIACTAEESYLFRRLFLHRPE